MKLGILLTYTLCCFFPVFTQVQPYFCYPEYLTLDDSVVKEYPFIRFDKNEFTFYSKPDSNWCKLANQFTSSQRKTPLHIYHFGGSHIQADIYTHDVRQFLAKKLTEKSVERGVLFPFGIGKTNNPSHYSFKSSATWKSYRNVTTYPEGIAFGVFGMTLFTKDSIVPIAFEFRESQAGQEFTQVTFLHQPGAFSYTIDTRNLPEVNYVVCDTVVGKTSVYFHEPQNKFALNFYRVDSLKNEFQWNGVLFELDSALFSYNAIGVNGASLPTYLSQKRFEQTLALYPPQICVLSVGTNDANVPVSEFDPLVYKQNLESLMRRIRSVNPTCQFVLTVPNDAYFQKKHPNKNIPRQQVVIHELARQYGCAVWDVFEIMGGLGSAKTWQKQGLMAKDFVHFTATGYHLKGALLSDAFEKWLEQMNFVKE